MIYVTQHALKRCKQRLGLPKSACQRHAQRAYDKGVTQDEAKGNAKTYLNYLSASHQCANQIRLYGEFIFIFNDESLITVLPRPKKFL